MAYNTEAVGTTEISGSIKGSREEKGTEGRVTLVRLKQTDGPDKGKVEQVQVSGTIFNCAGMGVPAVKEALLSRSQHKNSTRSPGFVNLRSHYWEMVSKV